MASIEFDARIALTVDEHGYLKIEEDEEGTDYLEVESLEINEEGVVMDIDVECAMDALKEGQEIADAECEDDGETRIVTIWVRLWELKDLPTFRVVE